MSYRKVKVPQDKAMDLAKGQISLWVLSYYGGCHFEDHVMHPSHDNKIASDWSVFLDTSKHQQTKINISKHYHTLFGDVCLCLLTDLH